MTWHYAIGGEKRGPVSESDLRDRIQSGEIDVETLIWAEGMNEWRPLGLANPEFLVEGSTEAASGQPREPMAVCSVSGAILPESEMLQYGDRWVSPDHKETFLQQLREGQPSTAAGHQLSGNGYSYRDPAVLSKLAKWSIAISTGISILFTIADFASQNTPEDELSPALIAMGLLGVGMLGFFIVVVVIFCMWTYRVAANAWSFGGNWMTASPGWSVGWYFIPFANLWKPYTSLKGVWQSSHQSADVSPAMPLWWTLWIATNVLGQISFRLVMAEAEDASMVVDVIAIIVDIPLTIALWMIISRISEAQIKLAAERTSP
jgi:hypothetical protein